MFQLYEKFRPMHSPWNFTSPSREYKVPANLRLILYYGMIVGETIPTI